MLSDEKIIFEMNLSKGVIDTYNKNILQVCKDVARLQEQETLKDISKWIDRNILQTDNRVTKLWVLGDAMKLLREGKFPE